ncbi:hypothetical protein BGW80DRAFT_1280844 [Lactifluus volemus]|nr:hypothetical protein BGW80DRAFT_1280844 [Lactifluus volemus]
MYSIRNRCSPPALTIYPLDQAMAPTNSCRETHQIPHTTSQSIHLMSSPPLVWRSSHRYSLRRASLVHKRRFRSRQSVSDSPAVESTYPLNVPSPPYTATLDLRLPVLSSANMPPTATSASGSHWSALQQSKAAIHHTTAITAALIVVCVLMGLAACAVISSLAYRRRLLLPKWLRWNRRAEDDLGFVFVEYDDSTWGTTAKDSWKVMPSFEAGGRELASGEAHPRAVDPDPLTEKVERNTTSSIHSLSLEVLRDASHCDSGFTHTMARGGSERVLGTIVETDEQDLGDASTTQDFSLPTVTHGNVEMSNALGLAMGGDENLKLSTLASPELAAVLALRAGTENVDVLAPPTIAQWELSNTIGADDAIEQTASSTVDSLASDLAACVLSTESSGSEEDYELHRVETRSMDFERGIVVSLGAFSDIENTEDKKSPLSLYVLPRIVIPESKSVASEVVSSDRDPNHATGVSETTIDLGDFPNPPIIGDTLKIISTSLISEIEISLGPII